MSGHTELPWRTAGGDAILSGRNADLTVVGSIERPEDAEFVIRACNSHYELLEALELLIKRCGPFAPDGKFARAVIAKAKGEDA